MKAFYPFFLLLIATSCFSSKMMTTAHYNEVFMGQKADEVEAKYGTPYEVRVMPNGLEEYVYLEHIPIGRNKTFMREYVIVIENGKVIDKKMHDAHPHSLQFSNE